MDRDHRDFLRVEDSATVSYQHVTADEADTVGAVPFPVGETFRNLEAMHALEIEARDLIQLGIKDPTVAAWTANVNQRLDLISRSLLAGELDAGSDPAAVVISCSGIAFTARELLSVGSYIGVKVIFAGTSLGFTAFAEIRQARLSGSGHGYVTGARFHNLRATTRHVLERHIIRIQAMERHQRLSSHQPGEPQ